MGEDLLWGKDQGIVPELKLQFQTEGLADAGAVSVKLNGQALSDGELTEGRLEYTPEPGWIRKGINEIEITLRDGGNGEPVVKDLRLRVAYGN